MSGVVGLLSPVKGFITYDKLKVDSTLFRFHTQYTVLFLVVSSLILTASQYLGDPIDCVVEEIPPKIMDTYCWIHSTFTFPYAMENVTNGVVAHPGVRPPSYRHNGGGGNPNAGNNMPVYHDKIHQHKYYQWVCFVLFFQAILFYIPRRIWNGWSKGKLDISIPDIMIHKVSDKRMPAFGMPKTFINPDKLKDQITMTLSYMRESSFKTYYARFIFCEILNLVNTVGQIFFIDFFLGGVFTEYGSSIISEIDIDPEYRVDPLALFFPKVTKCTFQKFGPSGTIQNFDGLCVLPLNIFNEKIYVFFYFYLIGLSVANCVNLILRLLTYFSSGLRARVLSARGRWTIDAGLISRVNSRLNTGEWFLLSQFGANLDPTVFKQFLIQMDDYYRENEKQKVLNQNKELEEAEEKV